MNKAEFLHILRDRLSVLDEKELEDILSEYEQHIDMKAAGAMTEEAAIADFGDIGELTAQILEAYHVRADFAREKEIREKGPGMMDTVMVTGRKTAAACRRGGRRFLQGLKNSGLAVQKWIKKCVAAVRTLFSRKKGQEERTQDTVVKQKEIPERKKLLLFGSGKHKEKRDTMEKKNRITLFSIIGMICRGCFNAVLWCVKLVWNLFCTGTGILIGAMACACIFMLGTLLVLLTMGYPLAGVVLGVLGLTMCTCSMTVLCFTLIVKRKRQEGNTAGPEEAGTDEEEEIVHA